MKQVFFPSIPLYSLQFDDIQKRNVGVKTKVDLKFVKENSSPTPEFLKENVITEANVSLLTSLSDSITMPGAVEYMTKSGKDGIGMLNLFTKQVSVLQCCKACVEKTPSVECISKCDELICVRKCHACINAKAVCKECKTKGHLSYSPCLRACDRCLSNNLTCVRLVILALSSDCEEGNKKAMEILEEQQKEKKIIPNWIFVFLFLMAFTCSFANWFCLFEGHRVSLTVLNTLRDDSDPMIRAKMRKLLMKEDVQNKDRMAVNPIPRLSSTTVQKILQSIGKPVVHTLVPDKYRLTDTNKVGLYPHPVSVTLGPTGKLLFLDYNPLNRESKLCLADLHSPVRVEVLKSGLKDARSLTYLNRTGLAFLQQVTVVKVAGKMFLKTNSLKTKKSVEDELLKRGVRVQGTVAEMKERLEESLKETHNQWKESRTATNSVKMDNDLKVDVICKASEDMLIIATNTDTKIYTVETSLDGVGVLGSVKDFGLFHSQIKEVVDMCVVNRYLIVAHKNGLAKFCLQTRQYVSLLSNNTDMCTSVSSVAPYASDRVVFTDTGCKRISVFSLVSGEVEVMACTGREGNSDGTCAAFSQPMGICVEHEKNVFVTDAQVGAVKLVTDVSAAVPFLKNLGVLYNAFCVHLKHKKVTPTTLENCEKALVSVSRYLRTTVSSVQALLGSEKITNGPDGTVANKTVLSVSMLANGIARIATNVRALNHRCGQVKPESLLSVKVENFHAVSHFKHPTCPLLQYARDFGATVFESAKQMTRWSAFYFTHPTSYYPVPTTQILLSDVPKMQHQSKMQMSIDDMETMSQGAWQLAGTLRLNIYGRSIEPSVSPVVFEQNESQKKQGQVSEYDSESDEEELNMDSEGEEESGESA